MRLAVVGTGYVGLVPGACFAERGFETWFIDRDAETAELTKYACNSFLATKVAFINDGADLRNAFDAQAVAAGGLHCYGIGARPVAAAEPKAPSRVAAVE